MGAHYWSRDDRTAGQRALWAAIGLSASLCAACQLPPAWLSPVEDPDSEAPLEIAEADTGFTLARFAAAERSVPQAPGIAHQLTILHILVPQGNEGAVEKVWNLLREDVLSDDTRFRLAQNGLRVGVGHAQWWEPITVAMEAIDDHRVTFAQTVRMPVGFPLTLEFDDEPHEQTLFYVGPDGILSGATWAAGRNVLRIACAPDAYDSARVRLFAVPEVHQRRDGWEWVRNESGLWNQAPRHTMQVFDAAGFVLSLSPGEFVLLAPSESSRIYGLLGGAFLTRVSDRTRFDSYVFMRPEIVHVGKND